MEDPDLAKEVGLHAVPSVVFFRNYGDEAVIYAGDIKNEDSILEWLLVQMDPSNEAIEDQDGEELEDSIENYDSLAVFICKGKENYYLRLLKITIIKGNELAF